jgi:L-ascorbate metabolism protein UlaG (beta-lactamase superfamily)
MKIEKLDCVVASAKLGGSMKVTMIGHSTVLIEAAGMKILTDPYFGTWGNLAYKRTAPPSRTREELEAVDLVLVSHNHWDHTDSRYFRALAVEVPVVAPRAAIRSKECGGSGEMGAAAVWLRCRDSGARAAHGPTRKLRD